MDNRQLDVVSEGRLGFEKALEIIWPAAAGGKATHSFVANYKMNTKYFDTKMNDGTQAYHHISEMVVDPEGTPTLILLWNEEREAKPLPYPLLLPQAIDFAWGWLEQVPRGRQPDHDGDNGKGWRVFTEMWGHVAHHRYAIVGIQPAWAMYGK